MGFFALCTKVGRALVVVAFVQLMFVVTESYSAQEKVGVVDMQRMLQDSLAAKSASQQLNKKRNEWQAEIEKKESELNKLNQELVKQQSVLNPESFDVKVREFNSKVADVQNEFQAKKNIIDQAEADTLIKIEQTVLDIVADIASTNGLAMVFPANRIVYYVSSLDITEEVLKKLDVKLQKVDVKFTSQADSSPSTGSKKK